MLTTAGATLHLERARSQLNVPIKCWRFLDTSESINVIRPTPQLWVHRLKRRKNIHFRYKSHAPLQPPPLIYKLQLGDRRLCRCDIPTVLSHC